MIYGPRVVTDGLILALDASDPNSYSGSGSTWNDLSGRGNHASITGSVPFVSNRYQSYFNFVTASTANYISNATASLTYKDVTIVFYPDFNRGNSVAIGLLCLGTTSNGYGIYFNNSAGTWRLANPGGSTFWLTTSTTIYINGTAQASSNPTPMLSGWNILSCPRSATSTTYDNAPYYIGVGGASSATGFQGRIAAVYLYDRVLTVAERIQNANALRRRFEI